jgi:hypothetical protein
MYITQDRSIWEYKVATDAWTKMMVCDSFATAWICGSVVYKNRGFFIQYDEWGFGSSCAVLWEYVPAINQVIKYTTIIAPEYWLNEGSFLIDDKLYLPLRNFHMMEYDFLSSTTFCHDSPSDQENFNFTFVNEGKAIIGINSHTDVYRFYPR